MDGPFYKGARGSMGPQRRARIFEMRGGVCGNAALGEDNWGCTRKLRPPADKDWQIEHEKALENGGEDVDENCFVACSWCAAKKNPKDHAEAAHSRRAYTNHVVPSEHRRSRWGRR